MRKIVCLVGMLAIFSVVWGANQVNEFDFVVVGDVAVDSQYTGNWEPMESLVVALADSGYVILEVSGIAYLGPYDKLFIGLGSDSANKVDSATGATTGQTHTNLDTNMIAPPVGGRGALYMPFHFVWIDSTLGATGAATDTFYFNAATGQSGHPVSLYDVVFTSTIVDFE